VADATSPVVSAATPEPANLTVSATKPVSLDDQIAAVRARSAALQQENDAKRAEIDKIRAEKAGKHTLKQQNQTSVAQLPAVPAAVNDTLSQQASEIVNGTKDVDKSLSDVQSQLQKAVAPVQTPKINDTELLKRTAKKAVAASK